MVPAPPPIVAATPGGAAAPRLISAPLSRESEGPQQSIDQLHNNKALELFVSCTTLSRRAVLRAVPRAQARAQAGWTDGRNVRIDIRWGAGDPERIRKYAAELVALAPDVILASGGTTLGPERIARMGIVLTTHTNSNIY